MLILLISDACKGSYRGQHTFTYESWYSWCWGWGPKVTKGNFSSIIVVPSLAPSNQLSSGCVGVIKNENWTIIISFASQDGSNGLVIYDFMRLDLFIIASHSHFFLLQHSTFKNLPSYRNFIQIQSNSHCYMILGSRFFEL